MSKLTTFIACIIVTSSVLVSCASPSTSQRLGKRVQLDMYIASAEPDAEFTRSLKLPNHTELWWANKSPFLTNECIERVYWTNGIPGKQTLGIDLTDAGAAILKHKTEMYQQKILVIELNGKVVFAPFLRSAISKRALISVDDEDRGLLEEFARSMGAQGFTETVSGKGLRLPRLQ